MHSVNRTQLETQSSAVPLQMTGTHIYHHTLISTKSPPPASSQSAQPSPSQVPFWEEKAILCYGDRRGENMAYTACTERGTTRGME
jgi:hypothetical protein